MHFSPWVRIFCFPWLGKPLRYVRELHCFSCSEYFPPARLFSVLSCWSFPRISAWNQEARPSAWDGCCPCWRHFPPGCLPPHGLGLSRRGAEAASFRATGSACSTPSLCLE